MELARTLPELDGSGPISLLKGECLNLLVLESGGG
jgi:hypothetical protein